MYFKLVEFISWLFSLPLRYLLSFNLTKHVVRRVTDKLSITGYQYQDWHYDERAWRTRLLRFIDRVINFPTSISYNLNWHMQLPLYKAFGGQICNYCQWWIEPGKVHQYCLDQLEKELDDDWPDETYASDWPDDGADGIGWGDFELCFMCWHPAQDHTGKSGECTHQGSHKRCNCNGFKPEERSDPYDDDDPLDQYGLLPSQTTYHGDHGDMNGIELAQ